MFWVGNVQIIWFLNTKNWEYHNQLLKGKILSFLFHFPFLLCPFHSPHQQPPGCLKKKKNKVVWNVGKSVSFTSSLDSRTPETHLSTSFLSFCPNHKSLKFSNFPSFEIWKQLPSSRRYLKQLSLSHFRLIRSWDDRFNPRAWNQLEIWDSQIICLFSTLSHLPWRASLCH